MRNFGVDVEIWDVVDRARGPGGEGGEGDERISGLEEEEEERERERPESPVAELARMGSVDLKSGGVARAADARLINVYKNAHGVIICMDPIKEWTWEYVKREVQRIPKELHILVLANFCDLGRHRRVSEEAIKTQADEWRDAGRQVLALEASMLNGYGFNTHSHKTTTTPTTFFLFKFHFSLIFFFQLVLPIFLKDMEEMELKSS
ncbi:MAG: hypothetical protein Q8P67_21815 [archaeon]|nr:hypothetical protein [archaeon]